MINFRYHLVSLTAVFLALTLGIVMGATVVDRATVEQLEDRLDRVQANVERTESENTQLREGLERWERFAGEAETGGNRLVAGRLVDVPVILVSAQGLDGGVIGALQASLVAAGAKYQGNIVITDRLRLREESDRAALAQILGVPPSSDLDPDELRSAAISRLAASWAAHAAGTPPSTTVPADPATAQPDPSPGPSDAALLLRLVDAGLLQFDAPDGPSNVATVPLPGTRFVVAGGTGADVPDADVVVPLVTALATSAATPTVVAVEAGADAAAAGQPTRAVFVGVLRGDEEVADRVATVDNIEDFRGRIAAVLATELLGSGQVGHYGVGEGASQLLPAVAG